MRLRKLIKQFDFEERNRGDITLGPGVRLHPTGNYLELEADDSGVYPTDADLYARTWVANPNSVKQWLGFEIEDVHYMDFLGDPLTALNYRLGDGVDEYYWDGNDWIISLALWNTEDEISANITTFPITDRKIQVIINLSTTDETVSPRVTVAKILYASDVEYQEDLIFRSLIPMLKDEIRPIADYPVVKQATSDTVDMNDYPLDTPYELMDIDSVFDHTNDPNHLSDLLQSYDSGTGVITLSASIAADDVAWIKFTYRPVVAATTSQEWYELDRVPAIVLADINLVERSEFPWAADTVANKGTGEAVLVPGPTQTDVDITMRILTDKSTDQIRLVDEVRSFFSNNRHITSYAMDEKYDLCVTTDYDSRTLPGQSGLHVGIIMFRIKRALFFQEQAINTYIAQRLVIGGDMDVTID